MNTKLGFQLTCATNQKKFERKLSTMNSQQTLIASVGKATFTTSQNKLKSNAISAIIIVEVALCPTLDII